MGRGGQDELTVEAPSRGVGRAQAERRLSELPGFAAWKKNPADIKLLNTLSESGVVNVDEGELAALLERDVSELHAHLAELESHDLTRRSGRTADEMRWSLTNVGSEVATGERVEFYAPGDLASLDGEAVKVVEMEGEYGKVLSLASGELRGPIHSDELQSLGLN